jgi:UDP-glucose 4-epimerase
MLLLTGGLGFIGSHTAVVMSNMNYEIVILDNLCNSKIEVLDNIKKLSKNPDKIFFYNGDLLIKSVIIDVFSMYNITEVIHFASLKSVNESIKMPLLYYRKNINILINLLEVMSIFSCKKLIFSSSATVYGSQLKSPLNENMLTGSSITNPYGQTKYFQEQILNDYAKNNPSFSIVILRYFNPLGSHPSGLIGENPNDTPNNLFPYLLKVISNDTAYLSIFGNNYNTKDGTCIRDFIHVMDLAEGHSIALEKIKKGIICYNLGTGKGTSVLELIEIFNKVNNVNIPYKIENKRDGDIDISYADVSKVFNELNWKTKYSIEDICRDGYNYLIQNNLIKK